jgi:hypothetical protein
MNRTQLVESLRSRGHVSGEQLAAWRDVSGLLAALDAIGRDGANAVLKIDGGRPDGSVYTVVISGGRLGEAFFRKDGDDLAALLAEAVEFYKARAWSDAV